MGRIVSFFSKTLVSLLVLAATDNVTGKDALTMLRDVKIEKGRFTLVEYADAPTWIAPNETEFRDLPPRTMVRIVLHPVKGSNIQVEIWLPTAENWNGRFLG